MSHLISIEGYDFTGWTARRSYSANHEDIYAEWEDINRTVHRTVIRQKISATCQMLFFSETDYGRFLDAVGIGNVHPVRLYVSSLREERTINAFISYQTKTVWATAAFDERVAVISVECEITEQ